ncbi:MAG: response regulator transcription factor [Kiritimatiellae bacterium]|nr:response regulator transcription factor [Kiritimatiellia bacterium]MDD5521917.1 response regulator transcription factor [Kiritimatiellia bacterium]
MKERKQTILVVEDDEALVLGLEENLKFAGYDVVTAREGNSGLKAAMDTKPDLILLDIMLPGMSGYDICRKLRDNGMQMPVVMLTARQDEFDKVHGFEMGADDYVTKPFSLNELLARIKAILLRGSRRVKGPMKYDCGDFVLDLESRVLKRRKAISGKRGSGGEGEMEEMELTRTEFDLLAYFCANEGKALTREHVMNDVWGMEYYGTQRSLDSFVASLRSKIEKKPSEPKHILTVHGVGYKYVK